MSGYASPRPIRKKAEQPEPSETFRYRRVYSDGYATAIISFALLAVIQIWARDPQIIPAWIPIFLFLVGLIGLVRANWIVVAFLGFPAWSLLGAIISNRLIEGGEYIGEQFRTGFANGATAMLALYALGILLVAHSLIALAIGHWHVLDRNRSAWRIDRFAHLMAFALCIVLIFYAVTLGMYGIANDGDRFAYWNRMDPIMRAAVLAIRSLTAPIVSGVVLFAILTQRRSTRATLYVLVVLIHVPLSLMGDKFSPFVGSLLAALAGMAVAFLYMGKTFRLRASYMFWGGIAVAAIITALVQGTASMSESTGGDGDTSDAIFGRTVLQGHVWFGVLDRWNTEGGPLVGVDALLGLNSLENPTGLDRLSLIVSRPEYVLGRLARGVTFTMGGPAAPLALAGPFGGLIIFTLLGVLYSLQFAMILKALANGRHSFAMIGWFASVSINSVVLMGNWYSAYNSVGLLVLAASVVLAVAPRRDPYSKRSPRPQPAKWHGSRVGQMPKV